MVSQTHHSLFLDTIKSHVLSFQSNAKWFSETAMRFLRVIAARPL